jgi:ribonuclease D
MNPSIITTQDELQRYADLLAKGSGPVAIDAERASGFRYTQRAYLIQMKRAGSGVALIDPVEVPDLAVIHTALESTEWILHAATQDLSCLAEVGLTPAALFDTELAGRLLGRERVNLAALLKEELQITIEKGQGATDWSRRPLSDEQIRYAALDVEYLIELRDALEGSLREANKWSFAEQEFAALREFTPKPPGEEPWRRLSGIHRIKQPVHLAIARELWVARDSFAAQVDIAPGRIISDAAIVAASEGNPTDATALLELPGFHGRYAAKERARWWAAIDRARQMPPSQWPERVRSRESHGVPRQWARSHPEAFARWEMAKLGIGECATQLEIPAENLLTPSIVRVLAWDPPADLERALTDLGARPWQIAHVLPILRNAMDTPASQVTDE